MINSYDCDIFTNVVENYSNTANDLDLNHQLREFKAKKLAVQELRKLGLKTRNQDGSPTDITRGWIEYYAFQLALRS